MQNWSISSEICPENSYEIGSFFTDCFFGKVSSENFSEIPVKSANFSCVNPNVFPCPKRTVLVSFHLGLQIKVSQYTATRYILITTETTEHHGNFDFFIFNTIECDWTTWLARWKVDRSTPQSVRTLSVDRALQTQSRPVLNHFTLPSPGDSYHFVLCTTVQQKHSPHNEITCTLYRVIIAHPHVPFNILLWIKTVWFECKLSCISDVYSAWMWSAVHNLKSLYPFTLIILLSP